MIVYLQMCLVGCFESTSLVMIHCISFLSSGITAGTTFASAVSYAFSKSVYKFKFREHDHQYGKRIAVFIFYILFNLAFLYSMPIKQQENETDKNVLEEKKHK